jgi:hypothetical protein
MLMGHANFGKRIETENTKSSFYSASFKKHEERNPMSHSVNLYVCAWWLCGQLHLPVLAC